MWYLTRTLSGSWIQKQTEKLSLSRGDLRRHDNLIQHGTLDSILEQKEDINDKAGEIQIKSGT